MNGIYVVSISQSNSETDIHFQTDLQTGFSKTVSQSVTHSMSYGID